MSESWRIFVVCSIKPAADVLIGSLRELGHVPVALLAPRRDPEGHPLPEHLVLTDRAAPPGLDLLFARDKHALEPLFRAYEPDVMICWGFPWKIPQDALDIPRYGSVNHHPAALPRHRGPIPLSWALREGDSEFYSTWHRMDAELDTGAILAQKTIPILDEETTIWEMGPRVVQASVELLPRVFERLAAGDPGEPQADEGASWAGFLEEDYATIDWSQTSREIHNQVRAWSNLSSSAER